VSWIQGCSSSSGETSDLQSSVLSHTMSTLSIVPNDGGSKRAFHTTVLSFQENPFDSQLSRLLQEHLTETRIQQLDEHSIEIALINVASWIQQEPMLGSLFVLFVIRNYPKVVCQQKHRSLVVHLLKVFRAHLQKQQAESSPSDETSMHVELQELVSFFESVVVGRQN